MDEKYNFEGIFELVRSCDSGSSCIDEDALDIILANHVYLNGVGEVEYKPMTLETFSYLQDQLTNDPSNPTCQSCDGALEWTHSGKDVTNYASGYFWSWFGEDSNHQLWIDAFERYKRLPDLKHIHIFKTLNYPK
jgi:hypothetical protein